jgi:hypothetical protein
MKIRKFNENNKYYNINKIFGYNQYNSINESGVLLLIEKYGKEYDKFFTETSLGEKGKSYKDYIEFYENLPIDKISNIFKKHDKGNFSDHISKSIPGHKEVQKMTAFGVVNVLINKNNSIVLDIGGSDNTWAKTVTDFSNGRINSITIDPNTTMKEISDKISKVRGNEYKTRSFIDSFDDIKALEEDEKFDCVHESMTFQFISDKRGKHIKYIKDKLLKKGGFVLLEEKLYNKNWDEFEKMKDEYKKKYFSEEDIAKKGKKNFKTRNE